MFRTPQSSAFAPRVIVYLLVVAFVAVLPKVSLADYLVVGSVKGQSCLYYGPFWNCTTNIAVDAIEGPDGKLYNLPTQYTDVAEYDEETGICLIRIANVLPDPFGWLVDQVNNPTFFERQSDGIFKELDLDFLQFFCKKTTE